MIESFHGKRSESGVKPSAEGGSEVGQKNDQTLGGLIKVLS